MRQLVLRYGVAVGAVGLAAWARWLLHPWLGEHLPFVTFFFAILVTAWYGGFGPTLLAVLLGSFTAVLMVFGPQGHFQSNWPEYVLGLGLFLLSGIILSLLFESLRTAKQRCEAAAAQALARQRELEHEVAERARAEAANDRLAAIVHSSEDAIIGKGLDGTVTSWNAAAERLFGYKAEEIVGRPFTLLVPSDRTDEMPSALTLLRQGEQPAQYETVRLRKDGTRVHVAVRLSPIRDKNTRLAGASIIARDISDRKQIEEQLRENEQRLRLLAEAVPGILFSNRSDGACDYVSPRFYELTGMPPDSALGSGWATAVHAEDRGEAWRRWQKSLREGRSYESVSRFRHADGTYHWYMVRSAPLKDAGGRVLHWFGACTDIDAAKRAEDERARLLAREQQARAGAEAAGRRAGFLARASAALASSLDYETTLARVARLAVPQFADWVSVDLLTEDGSLRQLAVAHVDPAKVEMAQQWRQKYPPDMSAAHGVPQVLRTRRPEFYPEITDELLRETLTDPEQLARARELGLKSAIIVPLAARGWTLGAVTLIMAESGRQYSAEDLALAEDLARRAAVAVDNARLYREVQDNDRRKDQFLAMLAHELRNPLAPIRNAVHVMGMLGPLDPTLQWSREVIERQVTHLARLVDDLLDLSRLMRGMIKLQKERVELATVVAHAVEAARPFIDERGHELAVMFPPEPAYLDADLTRLTQVLVNLLNNAAKYTNPGGHIRLSAARTGEQVVFQVRDDGRGMPPDLLPRVFDLFTQGERTLARSEGGLGIGLTLVRSLVEMHGGTVEAHSAGVGKGSTFIVRLPALPQAVSPARAERRDGERERCGSGRRILVVDDNADAAESLALLLRVTGHEVRTATNGLVALETARTLRPEIVLLDLGMPEMDGYEVARRLRREPGLEKTLLVALTGYNQDEDVRRSREAGFDLHLPKPANLDILQGLLAPAGKRGG